MFTFLMTADIVVSVFGLLWLWSAIKHNGMIL